MIVAATATPMAIRGHTSVGKLSRFSENLPKAYVRLGACFTALFIVFRRPAID